MITPDGRCNIACENRTPYGYCGLTACIKFNYHPSKTRYMIIPAIALEAEMSKEERNRRANDTERKTD